MADKTKHWELYENGVKYNNSLEPNYYNAVNTAIDFFNDKQWRNLENTDFPAPVFNFIKRIITFFVAFLTSSKVKLKFGTLPLKQDAPIELISLKKKASEIADAEVANLFEKFKMDNRFRDACFDAAIMGDACAHFRWNPKAKPYGGAFKDINPIYENIEGEIEMELVDGTNVYFGNPNNPDVEVQPYIIVTGRDMVENLKAEAKYYKSQEIEQIQADSHHEHMAGDNAQIEIESDQYGKALYLYIYEKKKVKRTVKDKDGKTVTKEVDTIFVSKCTETAYIFKDIDTGLEHYPIAWVNWEHQKNCYHGRGVCFGIITNQIFINKMFAKIMVHLDKTAFPKVIYDKNAIASWDDGVGMAIGVDKMPGESINSFAQYMQPSQMSNQIIETIKLAIDYTKEALGVNEALFGDVNPENASGVAIATTVKQASKSLANPQANFYEWFEDIGRILLDMMGTYYGERPIVINRNGRKEIEIFDFSQFKNLWLNVKCDVGPSTYWSEIALVEMLNNLLSMKDPLFELIDYLEALPDGYKSQELVDRVKAKAEEIQNRQAEYEAMAQIIENYVPPELRQQALMLIQGNQQNMMV